MRNVLHSSRRSRGAALLLTIWCVVVVSLTVVLVARIVNADVDDESIRARRFEARQLALTGIAHGMNPKLPRDSEFFHQQRGAATLEVRLVSESARLNINALLRKQDHAPLKRLFALWGVPENEARIAVDSLTDWVDEGDTRRLNGAERDQLLQTNYSLPQNREFLSVQEMRRVRGMDAVARYQPTWADSFTVFGEGLVDLQDASAEVISAMGDLSPSQVAAFVRFRNGQDDLPGTADDRIIKNMSEVLALFGLDSTLAEIFATRFAVGIEPARIESTVTLQDVRYHISSVVDRKADKAVSLSWEES